MAIRGLSVSRAYISLEKPQVRANLRVSLGFGRVFWNCGKGDLRRKPTGCGHKALMHY
jgi:hypothetical protein